MASLANRHVPRLLGALGCAAVMAAMGSAARAQSEEIGPRQLIGTWHGTSLCTDRIAAPACHDEAVVYEFTPGPKAGTVHWAADELVNGQREPMGEFDLAYDKVEGCWKAEFNSPRVRIVWCLVADGAQLSGTARLLPGNQTIRKISLRKQSTAPPNKGMKLTRSAPAREPRPLQLIPSVGRT